MEQSLLKQLSVITEEEKEILAGRDGIDRSLYMAGDSYEIDSSLLLEKGKLITLRPHTRFVLTRPLRYWGRRKIRSVISW